MVGTGLLASTEKTNPTYSPGDQWDRREWGKKEWRRGAENQYDVTIWG